MNQKVKFRKYKFIGNIWKHKGHASWHFVTLPNELSKSIRKNHGQSEEGWGRLKATARIGNFTWQTAIWYDTKHKSYLLPVKAAVRKSEVIGNGDSTTVILEISVEVQSVSALWKLS